MKKSLLKALSIVLVLIMAVSFAAVSAEDIPDVELLNVKDAELTVGPVVQGTGSVILLGSQKEASATFAGALVGNTSGNVNLNVGDGGFSYTIEYIYSDGTMTTENSEVKGVAASGTNADGYSVYNHDFDITLDANKPGDFIFRF